jgi:hypothetical protein
MAEFFFLKGRSTELAIPMIEVFVEDFRIALARVRKHFS